MSKRVILDETMSEELPPDETVESSSKEGVKEITIAKYFQLYDTKIDKYQRAYAEARFHGIMKSKGSWEDTIKILMEGEK